MHCFCIENREIKAFVKTLKKERVDHNMAEMVCILMTAQRGMHF
jgi:hypothetical protein